MQTRPTVPALSERLCIGPTGLLRFNPGSGCYHAAHGLKKYNPNGFTHLLTDPFPVNDAYLRSLDIASHERRPRQSQAQRRDAWFRIGCFLAGLLLLAVLSALVQTATPAAAAPEEPMRGTARFAWHELRTAQ